MEIYGSFARVVDWRWQRIRGGGFVHQVPADWISSHPGDVDVLVVEIFRIGIQCILYESIQVLIARLIILMRLI
jgi:hypothetical protein